MIESWRWFGPRDPVPLSYIRQAGATAIVTALHHIPNGTVWSVEEIQKRQNEISASGLTWLVVESLAVSEDIKTRTGNWREHLDAYRQSLVNLSRCGITTVCYNFMPVIDWTRTDLAYPMPDGALALRFDATAFAMFDLLILQRPGAETDWDPSRIAKAEALFNQTSESDRAKLTRTIIAGLPGAEESYTLDMFRKALDRYRKIDAGVLRNHLAAFMNAVGETAREAGVNLCIHPDDPPRSLLGLPRIMSTAADVRWLFSQADYPENGLTFCTGSFGVRADNDLPAMFKEFAARVHFLHLRSTSREADSESFHEAQHLYGDVDMVSMVKAITTEERRRASARQAPLSLPMRPDHGHQILNDIDTMANPGYSAIGRLKGLAELRGISSALQESA